ncbi:hypothetical protein G6O69_30550 [Pseudenhygromyxa sp. WMMC2535]|uniref:hypothetical protein n=1 Tax=Pseudenhygromyxa sp. WMMC2535 TaxID=2712867 RepID=UPI001554CA5E|nr:hypothetical protein [Pseudenhygromyxa sp. WMMC2535]NVB42203.1 hypothetical protein [Pseudenhygromyxa sp. WMMC2535]
MSKRQREASTAASTTRAPRRGRGFLIVGALLGLALSTSACVEHQLLIQAPSLRGITIPLPPPSFADEVIVSIDFEGSVPSGFDVPGTKAYLYEKSTGRGYFTLTEGASFVIYDVLVDIDDNCLETWFVDGFEGEESSVSDYKVALQEGEEACSASGCSEMDEVGACVCLEKWSLGC